MDALVLPLFKGFDADAVIFHGIKYCDPHIFTYPYFREKFQENNLAMLYLEDNYTMGGIEQVKTRVQALLEMLEM